MNTKLCKTGKLVTKIPNLISVTMHQPQLGFISENVSARAKTFFILFFFFSFRNQVSLQCCIPGTYFLDCDEPRFSYKAPNQGN